MEQENLLRELLKQVKNKLSNLTKINIMSRRISTKNVFQKEIQNMIIYLLVY
jgi:hypothetical protein